MIFVQVPYLLSCEERDFFFCFLLPYACSLCLLHQFWSLLEFLSPAERPAVAVVSLDCHYWSNGTLLRKDDSLSSTCHCCPAYASFNSNRHCDLAKPLGWNKTWGKKSNAKIFPLKPWPKSTALGECGQLWWGFPQASLDHPGYICIANAQPCSTWHVIES